MGKTSDQRSVVQQDPMPSNSISSDEEGLPGKSMAEREEKSHDAVTTIQENDEALVSLGETVVAVAKELEGYYRWGAPALNADGRYNSFEALIKKGTPIGRDARINCWECVLTVAMESGALPEKTLINWMKANGAMDCDIDYNEKITELLGMKESVPLQGNIPEPGDIILFYGHAHVALSWEVMT